MLCWALFFQSCVVVCFLAALRVGLCILVPPPGMEPVSPAVKAQSLNHWITREVPQSYLFSHSFKGNEIIEKFAINPSKTGRILSALLDDVIDEKILEINVTSPCYFIKEINNAFKINFEKIIVDGIIEIYNSKRHQTLENTSISTSS